MRITVPVTIELTGELEPDERGLIRGSEHWTGGPVRADAFALAHLNVALHWPSEWMHGDSSLTVGSPVRE